MPCSSSLVMASLLWEKPSGRNWGRGVSEPEGGDGEGPAVCLPFWAPSRSGQQGRGPVVKHPSGQRTGSLKSAHGLSHRTSTLSPSPREVPKLGRAPESPGGLVEANGWPGLEFLRQWVPVKPYGRASNL